MRLSGLCLYLLLGVLAVSAQNATTNSSTSSEPVIVAAVINDTLCQQGSFKLQTFVDGQCSQVGSQYVWMSCNQTDPNNPFVLLQSFSSQSACAAAASGSAAELAANASVTYIDSCSPVGADMALNIVACTDSSHVSSITSTPSFATVPAADSNFTFNLYVWDRANCEGLPDRGSVIRFLTECGDYPNFWGPSAGFCVEGALIWPSYSDEQCTQLNASLPFSLEPTGVCFSAGDFSYMYGPCRTAFNYTGLSSFPAAHSLSTIISELAPANSTGQFSVAPASNPSQAVQIQQYVDGQCTSKNTSAAGLQTVQLGTCLPASNAAVGSTQSYQLFCTAGGVVAVDFNTPNCTEHHRSSELYLFGQCEESDTLGYIFAVSNCTASPLPASFQ